MLGLPPQPLQGPSRCLQRPRPPPHCASCIAQRAARPQASSPLPPPPAPAVAAGTCRLPLIPLFPTPAAGVYTADITYEDLKARFNMVGDAELPGASAAGPSAAPQPPQRRAPSCGRGSVGADSGPHASAPSTPSRLQLPPLCHLCFTLAPVCSRSPPCRPPCFCAQPSQRAADSLGVGLVSWGPRHCRHALPAAAGLCAAAAAYMQAEAAAREGCAAGCSRSSRRRPTAVPWGP